MAIRVQISQSKLSISSIFYYEFHKISDISFHTKLLQFPLRRISSVNYQLRHVIDHHIIRP